MKLNSGSIVPPSPQPFALLIPSGAPDTIIPDYHLEYRKKKLDAYLLDRPNLRSIVAMADTFTKTEDIQHTESTTTVHDGNDTFTTPDEKQDGIKRDSEQID